MGMLSFLSFFFCCLSSGNGLLTTVVLLCIPRAWPKQLSNLQMLITWKENTLGLALSSELWSSFGVASLLGQSPKRKLTDDRKPPRAVILTNVNKWRRSGIGYENQKIDVDRCFVSLDTSPMQGEQTGGRQQRKWDVPTYDKTVTGQGYAA